MNAFWAIFMARNREFYRDRAGFGWNIFFPFLLIVGFAAIFGKGPQAPCKMGWTSPAPLESQASDPAPAASSPFFQVIRFESLQEALDKLRIHKIDIVVQGQKPPFKHWISQTSPKGALAEQLFLAALTDPEVLRAPAARQTIQGINIHYIDWLFPGILAMNMMFSALFGVGYVVVRYRKDGVLKRLSATPLTAFQFLSAQVASRLVVIFFSTGLVFGVCSWLFGFRCMGSLAALVMVFLAGSSAHVALAMIVAARSASEEFASGILNVVSWPMMFLSEVWFSLEGAPEWVKAFSRMLPLTHVTEGMRVVMNQGGGFGDVLPQTLILAAITAVFMAIGSWRFKWTGA